MLNKQDGVFNDEEVYNMGMADTNNTSRMKVTMEMTFKTAPEKVFIQDVEKVILKISHCIF